MTSNSLPAHTVASSVVLTFSDTHARRAVESHCTQSLSLIQNLPTSHQMIEPLVTYHQVPHKGVLVKAVCKVQKNSS